MIVLFQADFRFSIYVFEKHVVNFFLIDKFFEQEEKNSIYFSTPLSFDCFIPKPNPMTPYAIRKKIFN